MRRARLDPSLRAQVRSRRPLRYDAGADLGLDRPAHVRAGSSVAWFSGQLHVFQDDASFVAVVRGPSVSSMTLPAGRGGKRQFDEGRGNKKDKLDLEASALVGDELFGFGSGSAKGRDRIVRVDAQGGVRLTPAPRLYAALSALTEFSGSELNVEGALATGDELLLFNRGNGAPRSTLGPVDATVSTSIAALLAYLDDEANAPLPPLGNVTRYDLGAVAGQRLTFTDATQAFGRNVYLAAAEDSPDATRDGPVAGVALGVLEAEPRYALVLGEDGAPLVDKLEGIAAAVEPGVILAVVDKDDPDVPSELLEIAVAGF